MTDTGASERTGGERVNRPEPPPCPKLTPTLAQQFLETLYGPLFSGPPGPAYLEVRGKREGEAMTFRRFYPNIKALLKDIPRWKPDLNYWIGAALRRDTRTGKKENLLALTAFFGDVDCGTAGHKMTPRYQAKAEALAAIEAFTLRPNVVVDSGGGFQIYWLLRNPVDLSNGNFSQVEHVNRGLALALGGDVGATDASRILRLPGTFNMKLAGNPRPVKIVWCEPERVYDLADFGEYEAQGKAQAQRRRQDHQGGGAAPGGEYAAYASKALADELAKLARTPAHDPGRNNQLNKSAKALGELVGAGVLDRGIVEAALYGVAMSIGLGEAETRTTIRSGIEAGIKEPRQLPKKTGKGRGAPRPGVDPASSEKGHQGGQSEPEAEGFGLCGHWYFVERGCLCLKSFDRKGVPYTSPLSNFQARITEEVSRDDGLKRIKEFNITGSLDTGRPLPPALIPAEKFDGLAWVKREWGAAATVAPGRGLSPHLVNAIQAHSRGFKRRMVYAHSGWRKIDGIWRYLHGGGAIGLGESVEVDLGEDLGNYRLSQPGGIEAAQASLRFLEVGAWKVTAPLLACVYLAPFADLLKVDFSLWIYGPTGGMKSSLAALALSHYGKFDRLTLPGSWISTANSLEKLTFTLKDTLCVIDDFMPAANPREFHDQTNKAARLVYQAGNRSSRGRLAPDLTARPNYHPRCLIVSTAETLLPGQRQSATARYLGVELDPKKTPIDEARLTAAQKKAHLYPEAMAAYLADLAPRLEDAQAEVKELWEGYRSAFQSTAHLRIPEIQAWLAVGFEMFLRFQMHRGTISEGQANEMLKRAWEVFEALGEKHSSIIEGQRPTLKFLAVLRELFYTGRIFVQSSTVVAGAPPRGLGWDDIEPAHNAKLIGWTDGEMLYLMSETALEVVHEAVSRQGDFLALGRNDMLAALAREGFILPGKDGRNTHVKNIQGLARRVICLPVKKLKHDEVIENETL